MENTTKAKAEIRALTKDLLLGVSVAKLLMDSEGDGLGDLMVEHLIEELQKMKAQKTRGEEKACEDAGSCSEPNTVDFAAAIRAVKLGKWIARKGWNGKNQHVELAHRISYVAAGGRVVNPRHDAIGNAALVFVGTSGEQVGWLASQADMLAEDWVVLHRPTENSENTEDAR